MPKKILIMLYNSFIISKLTYCLDCWGNAPDIHRNKIYLRQKKILRIINKKSVDYPTSELVRQDNILNIYKMYKFKVLQNAHSYFYSSPNPPIHTAVIFFYIVLPLHCSHQVSDRNHSLFNKQNY